METKQTRGGIGKHALLMVLCCAVPLAVLAAINVFRIDAGNLGYLAIMALCPLMHLFMMRGMGHDHSSHQASGGQSCHSAEGPESVGVAGGARDNGKVPVGLER